MPYREILDWVYSVIKSCDISEEKPLFVICGEGDFSPVNFIGYLTALFGGNALIKTATFQDGLRLERKYNADGIIFKEEDGQKIIYTYFQNGIKISEKQIKDGKYYHFGVGRVFF